MIEKEIDCATTFFCSVFVEKAFMLKIKYIIVFMEFLHCVVIYWDVVQYQSRILEMRKRICFCMVHFGFIYIRASYRFTNFGFFVHVKIAQYFKDFFDIVLISCNSTLTHFPYFGFIDANFSENKY